MANYTSKIKDIYDSLASIDVNIEEGEMVQVCLGDLSVADHMTCHKEWFSYLEKPMQPEMTLHIQLRMSVKFP